jgi:hypothetical protein
MTKGYMIFIEGGHEPKMVHDTFFAAEQVAKKHAREFPGKEVILLQIHKRIKSTDGKTIDKLEAHLPPKPPSQKTKHLSGRTLKLADLVFKEDAQAYGNR